VKLWSKLKYRVQNLIRPTSDAQSQEIIRWLGLEGISKEAIAEATYFTCLKLLSETMGKLPLKFKQETSKGVIRAAPNRAYYLLKTRPNPYIAPTVFWSTVEMNRNHYGNAYVFCRYNKKTGRLEDLWIMQSENVQVFIDDIGYFGNDNGIWYVYRDPQTNQQYVFRNDEVLHFKTSMTFNGIKGASVREILQGTLKGGLSSQAFMNNLYSTGLTGSCALEYTGDLDNEKRRLLKERMEELATGAENAGGMIPIPLGMKLTPLNIKLTDSQFFELKKHNALQIAGAFGIKPSQINIYDKSSYASNEAQQLSFYVEAMQYPLKQYEEEINFKLLEEVEVNNGCFYKYNEMAILRADTKTQMETLSMAVNNAIYAPNEARDILDMEYKEGGDQLMCNGNYIPITMIGAQYKQKEGQHE
jgi:HK97 family phage portal protein